MPTLGCCGEKPAHPQSVGRKSRKYHALKWSEKQGQYLAFIYNYTKIHGRSPAEAEMQRYFKVTPPTVHQMILKLEENGVISRVAGQARSISLLVPNDDIPPLK